MGSGAGHQRVECVPGPYEVSDVLGQTVVLLRHSLQRGVGVVLTGGIDARHSSAIVRLDSPAANNRWTH